LNEANEKAENLSDYISYLMEISRENHSECTSKTAEYLIPVVKNMEVAMKNTFTANGIAYT